MRSIATLAIVLLPLLATAATAQINPVCSGVPPTGQCIGGNPGTATGRCVDLAYTCSSNLSGTCSTHGGLGCVFCPGALCVFPPPTGTSAAFYTLPPCRLADTRNPASAPALLAGTARSFPVASLCGVPAAATSVAVNVTVVNATDRGNLTIYPAGTAMPVASTINFASGQTRANNAVIPLGYGGQITVQSNMPTGQTDFVLDVTGYFQ